MYLLGITWCELKISHTSYKVTYIAVPSDLYHVISIEKSVVILMLIINYGPMNGLLSVSDLVLR